MSVGEGERSRPGNILGRSLSRLDQAQTGHWGAQAAQTRSRRGPGQEIFWADLCPGWTRHRQGTGEPRQHRQDLGENRRSVTGGMVWSLTLMKYWRLLLSPIFLPV